MLFNIQGKIHMASRMKLQWRISPLLPLISGVRKMLLYAFSVNSAPIVRLNMAKQRILSKWFAVKYADFLDEYKTTQETAIPFTVTQQPTVWLLWMQGEESLPESCRMCVESIRRHNEHVRFLDYAQALDLVDVPDSIRDGYERGRLKPAHVADYIRFALLERYGGIWMDVSLLQVRDSKIDVLSEPFWSVKGLADFPYASAMPLGRIWQVYYMASQPHALFNTVMLRLMEAYYAEFDVEVDYFITYYFAALALSIPALADEYRKVPNNNRSCELLNVLLGCKTVDEHEVLQVLDDDSTWIYKCSTHYDHDETKILHMYIQMIDSRRDGKGDTNESEC
ncbi:capsular polysaccharide synthesis protein [Bifidobacterium pseudolongum]|uniref:capsular polysaccharide synthesis protein n=1 Tax=Bifidobacterium pseudolongum TaxID=1694 RepID=UPI00101F977C|nr:capsular polysaccharide synthesis protein [Bifidobacterium pseudolongum]